MPGERHDLPEEMNSVQPFCTSRYALRPNYEWDLTCLSFCLISSKSALSVGWQ